MTDDRVMLATAEKLDTTRERLINWGRWSRVSANRLHRCCSIEGRYRPERLHGDEEEDRRATRTMVDVRDALAVFRAVNPVYGFPVRLTLTLNAEYVFRMRPEQFRGWMRRHGHTVRERDYDELVAQAIHAAANALRRQESRVALDA